MKSSQKSRATVPQRLQGGKKSWQKISVVSLERICKVGGGRARGSREGGIERGTRSEAEEGCLDESKRREREKCLDE